jgi:hypothetical protein
MGVSPMDVPKAHARRSRERNRGAIFSLIDKSAEPLAAAGWIGLRPMCVRTRTHGQVARATA